MTRSSNPALPQLTPDDIASLTDSGSFSRGKTYRRQGAIYDAMRQGFELTAWCEGSSGGPYRVRAELANLADPDLDDRIDSKIIDWDCTCPRGGFCKHVVALLLTWIEDPDAFDAMPPLSELLAGKSREELIDLLDHLVTATPGLEREVLRLAPVPVVIPPFSPGAGKAQTVDLAAIRRQTDRALAPMQIDPWTDNYDSFDAAPIAADLEKVRAIGDQYAEAGRWADAQAVYTTVAERAMAQHNESFDVNGEVMWVIDACEVGLLRVLEAQNDLPMSEQLPPKARRDLLETAFRIWRFGYGGDPAAPLVAAPAEAAHATAPSPTETLDLHAFHAGLDWGEDPGEEGEVAPVSFDLAATLNAAGTADERALVEGWLRGVLKQKQGAQSYDGGLRRAAIRLQFDLQHASASKDARLEAYKGAGLWVDAIVLLAEMGQIHDAVALANRTLTVPYHATAFADYLVRQGGDLVPQAIAFIEDRLWETEGKNPHHDQTYQAWLIRMYGQHGLPEKAFAAELRRFKAEPTYPSYFAVQQAAALPGQEPGLWERIRPDLLKTLEERTNLPALFEAHFSAGEIGAARQIVQRMERGEKPKGDRGAAPLLGWHSSVGWPGLTGYRMKLAPLIADEHPDEAIKTYRDAAEQQIEYRQRTTYRVAAGYLAEVKRIFTRAGRDDEWKRYISTLRETYKRLPALQQELDAKNLR
jgi:uncharacterized Zn finger protein